eukprot:3715583-Prymnesium_polylepis.2
MNDLRRPAGAWWLSEPISQEGLRLRPNVEPRRPKGAAEPSEDESRADLRGVGVPRMENELRRRGLLLRHAGPTVDEKPSPSLHRAVGGGVDLLVSDALRRLHGGLGEPASDTLRRLVNVSDGEVLVRANTWPLLLSSAGPLSDGKCASADSSPHESQDCCNSSSALAVSGSGCAEPEVARS